MAFTRPAGRLHWLLIGPLVLQSALPAAALEAAGKGLSHSAETLLAQVPSAAAAGFPEDVQGWVDSANAAYTNGDSAEALRLQMQVVAWLQAHRPALDVFLAGALSNLGIFLSGVGQAQQALAPTEEAVRILQQMKGNHPEARWFLAMALNIPASLFTPSILLMITPGIAHYSGFSNDIIKTMMCMSVSP